MADLNQNIKYADTMAGAAVVSASLNTREDAAELFNLVKDIVTSVTKETKMLSQKLKLPDINNLTEITGFAYVTINE